MEIQTEKIGLYFQVLIHLIPIIATILTGSWYVHSFVSTLEKRVSILEINQQSIQQNMTIENSNQDNTISKIQDEMHNLNNKMDTVSCAMGDKMDRILMFFTQNKLSNH